MRKQPRRTSRFSQVFALLALTTITGLAITATTAGAAGVRFGFVDSVASWFGGGATVNVVAEPQPMFTINTTTVSLTTLGTAVTQNFDTLATSGPEGTLGPDGWYFSESGTGANTTYSAGTGSGTTGDTFSFGATASTERAFGGLQSNSLNPTIGAQLTNNTGSTVNQLAIDFTGEQWRLGATGRVDQLDFQYSTDATSLTTGTWTDVNNLDFVAPVTTGSTGALDGNVAPNRTVKSSAVTNLLLANGSTIWIRWNDFNASGSDDGLAIDDISITPKALPSVTTNLATLLTGTTATLNGTVNPNGNATTVWFRYSSTDPGVCDDTFGTKVPAAGLAIGSGTTNVAVAEPITGLAPGSLYYYCAIAENVGAKTVNPTLQGFITPVPPPPTATVTGASTICAGGSGTVTVTVSGGTAPYTVVLTNGGGTQSGAGPTFNFPVSPGSTTGYTLAAGSVDASSTAITTGDTATITVNQPPTPSNAGPNQTVVGSTATLAGNTPSVGTGTWSIVAGVGGSFTSPNNPNSDFTGLPGFIYTLRWTISNAPCSSSTNDVVITLNKASTSLANLTVPPSGLVGNSLNVSTVLNRTSAPAGPVAGEAVTFTFTSSTLVVTNVVGTTDGSGLATVAFTPTERGGYSVVANFAGSSTLAASTSNTESITVYQRTSLAFAGGSGAAGSPITLTATLTAVPSGAPIQGQFVQFNFGGTPSNLGAATDASGVATVTPTFPTGGTFSTTAFFSNTPFYFVDSTGALVPTIATANVNVTGCVTDPVVLNSGNAGTGSLRQAVIDACAGSTITFGDGSGGGGTNFTDGTADTITLASQITIDKNLTIEGTGADMIAISGNNLTGVLSIGASVPASIVTISGLMVRDGRRVGVLPSGDFGAGIRNYANLTILNSAISNNSVITAGLGGGIANIGNLTLTNSTISGNFSQTEGGGLSNSSGASATITNCTFSGNSTGGGGGAIFNNTGAGAITIRNSTISNNTAGAGAGIYLNAGNLNIGSSIFAGNTGGAGPDLSLFGFGTGTITSVGYNLIGNIGATAYTPAIGDQVGTSGTPIDALLGPLASNGGRTQTHALLVGSPAIDKGINALALANDQRGAGFARTIDNPSIAPAPSGDNTDIGAFEAPPPPSLGTYPATTVDLSDNVTVTPSAVPTNTTSISVSAPTSFIGKLTADPATGVVRITNAHLAKIPAGAYPITVKAFGPGGTTTATFNLAVTTTACGGTSGFNGTTDVSIGIATRSVAVGDFNGDGIQDIATANQSLNTVSIRLGDGLGGFTGSTNVSVGSNTFSVAVGDFNGDGKQDIAAANFNSNTVSIRLGDGSGGFTGTTEINVGVAPASVAVGDFNGDGIQDIAAANGSSNTVSIRLGDGSGGFTGTTDVSVGVGPLSVAVADFNVDGIQDIATANQAANTVSIRLGDGSGGFTGTTEVNVGLGPWTVAVGDFNGDGVQDIATSNFNGDTVSIRIGNGSGGFTGTTNVSVGVDPISVAVGDFNGDGIQDIAAANRNSNTVSIRFGDGSGGFTGTTEVNVGSGQFSVAVGDFNGDGRQDIATANASIGANSVSIRLGTCFSAAASLVKTTSTAPIAIDQVFDYELQIDNTGNVPLDNMVVIDALPIELRVNSVRTGSYSNLSNFGAGEGVRVSFEKNTALGVFTLWGSSPNTATNTTLTAPPPGLGVGEYITRIRWEFGQAAVGMSSVNRPVVTGRVINPDNNGGPVSGGTNIENCASLSSVYTAGPASANSSSCVDFDVATPPTVTAVNPTFGPTAGGNSVVITGTNFTGATAVSFGGTLATAFMVDSPTQITATAPMHASGAVSVDVTTPGGTHAPNTLYTYEAETTVAVDGLGNLTITDTNGGDSDDNIVIACTPPNITITDSGTGLNQTILASSVTGSITVNTLGGNDTLTVNLSGCDFINDGAGGGLFFNGGAAGDDALNISGYSGGTTTYNYVNANDGNIVMAGGTRTGTITYTGLEPIVNSGTAADVIFNLPAVLNVATLADDGVGGNGLSRVSGATFETTDFANPTSSLTINRGTVSDQLLVNAVPELTSSIMLGSGAARFSQISIGGAATLASGNSFSAFALNSIFLTGSSSDVSTTGTGGISLNSARSVSMAPGSSLNSVDGAITLNGNQEAVSTIDNVNGIFMSGALVHATGTGVVTLNGRGGGGGSQNLGIRIENGSTVRGGSTVGTITTDLNGTGNAGANSHGIQIDNSTVTSMGGHVRVRGFSGPGTGANNYGVIPIANGLITSGGNGNVTVEGTGGSNGAGGNVGVIPHQGLGRITSGGTGTVTVTGTGGAGGNSHGVQLFRNGTITSGGAGQVSVNGTGNASSFGFYLNGLDQGRHGTSGGGPIVVDGTGGTGIATDNTASTIGTGGNLTISLIADTINIGEQSFHQRGHRNRQYPSAHKRTADRTWRSRFCNAARID
ncbi:MAG: VCBS repeat-containing protein [Acidobacteria bacterium]|nr:VCBS repeat-containing protein [Acidobacteriota bacterium]